MTLYLPHDNHYQLSNRWEQALKRRQFFQFPLSKKREIKQKTRSGWTGDGKRNILWGWPNKYRERTP